MTDSQRIIPPGDTKYRVIHGLKNSGYTDDGIVYAVFIQNTEGMKEQHQICFWNDGEGKLDLGFVYVWVEKDGVIKADY